MNVSKRDLQLAFASSKLAVLGIAAARLLGGVNWAWRKSSGKQGRVLLYDKDRMKETFIIYASGYELLNNKSLNICITFNIVWRTDELFVSSCFISPSFSSFYQSNFSFPSSQVLMYKKCIKCHFWDIDQDQTSNGVYKTLSQNVIHIIVMSSEKIVKIICTLEQTSQQMLAILVCFLHITKSLLWWNGITLSTHFYLKFTKSSIENSSMIQY